MLRPEFVRRKLQLIADDLSKLLQFRDITYEDLVTDDIRLAAVERILERIVLRAIDVNEHLIASFAVPDDERTTRLTYREIFLRLTGIGVYDGVFAERIAGSAGLRNILVHEYNDVDHRIVHTSIRTALIQYHAYIEAVSRFIDAQNARAGAAPGEDA